MPAETWKFTDDDRARLKPLIDAMVAMADRAVERVCELSNTVEGRVEILQGACEWIAEWFRERVLKQVDAGEWAGRGIATREQIDVVMTVDVRGAIFDAGDLIRFAIQPMDAVS